MHFSSYVCGSFRNCRNNSWVEYSVKVLQNVCLVFMQAYIEIKILLTFFSSSDTAKLRKMQVLAAAEF